jgi:ubiquinone/menaquinone biosynthesis C-methylase UbiE
VALSKKRRAAMRRLERCGPRATMAMAIALAAAATGGCGTLDAESQRLEEVLAVSSGAVVADVGAGQGEWTLEMARRVGPSGRVFASEIDPERISDIRRSVTEAALQNVVVVEGTPDDTKLPPGCCDAIFLRHVYHHLTQPEKMGASLRQALRPDGFLAVIDFNPPTRLLPRPSGVPDNRRGHGMPIEILIEEMSTQGFSVAQRIDDWFRFDYCVVFQPIETASQEPSRPRNGLVPSAEDATSP